MHVVRQEHLPFEGMSHEFKAGDHRFVNTGDGPLRQTDIHASSHFVTEWLEEPDSG